MKIKQITVMRGGTVNKGNFNNIRFDVSATAEIGADEDADLAFDKLRTWAGERAKRESQADG